MKLTRKQVLQTLFFLLLGLVIVYFQVSKLSPEEKKQAIESIKGANYYWIGIAMVISLFSHFVRGIRWAQLINASGEKVKPLNAFYGVLIGYFINGFVPRLGEVIRCVVLGKKEDVKFEKLLGTVVAERVFDAVTLLVIIMLTLLLQFNFLYGFLNERLFKPTIESLQFSLPKLLFFIFGFIALLAALFFGGRIISKRYQVVNKLKLKWESVRSSFFEGLQTIVKIKNKPLFVGYSLLMWLSYFFMSFFVFKSLTESKHLGVDAGMSVLTSGSLALILPTPGGLGSYHEFVSLTLQLYNVSEVIGVSLSWLIWLTNYLIILLGGVISLLLISINSKS